MGGTPPYNPPAEQGPVAMVVQRGPQLLPGLVGDRPRLALGLFLPIRSASARSPWLQQVVVGVATTFATSLRRDGVDHRSQTEFRFEVVEGSDDRQAVVDGGRCVTSRKVRLAGSGVHAARRWCV